MPRQPGLAAFAIRNPHLIVVSCIIVAVFGVLALLQLPKDLLPAANLPAVQILSFYPGMPVEEVQQSLSTQYELYTGQAVGIQHQESKSLVGVSIVRNYFNPTISLDTAIAQSTSLVMSVLRLLPPGTQPPLVIPFDPMAAVPLALVAVSGDYAQPILYDRARYEVRNAIQSVPGAMAPTVMGGAQREALAILDPKRLDAYELSPVTVVDRLTQLNTFVPSGDVKIGEYDYQIQSNGIARQIADMNEFPLRAKNGVPVLLKDVGQARDSSQIQTNVVMIDGKPQVYVPVYRQPGANSIRVVDEVRKSIAALEKRLTGYRLELVSDQSVFIRHAVSSIAEEALIGGGLAVLMVLLFLGNPVATLGILLCLGLAMLIPFLGLLATRQSINAMTLGGLALSIGVLVDNSIVVLENISKLLEKGTPSADAAIAGAGEVAMPVLASTLATLAVLLPVLLLSGMVKTLFAALSQTVMFALLGSYFVAMTVMPLFAAWLLKARAAPPAILRATVAAMGRLTGLYGRALALALRHRGWVLAGAAAVLLAGVLLSGRIGTELFPRADSGNFVLLLRLPTGTRIEKTAQFAKGIDARLREWIPARDLRMIIINAGVYYGFPAAYTPNSGTQDVYFDVELTEDRSQTSQYYAAIARDRIPRLFPGVDIGVELGGLLTSAINLGQRAPIDLQIQGKDPATSLRIAQRLLPRITAIPGAVDARIQQRLDAPAIAMEIDRKKAADLGLTPDDVVKNVVSAVSGSPSYNPAIWIDPKTGISYFTGVRFAEQKFADFGSVGAIPIRGPGQSRSVQLKRVAKLSLTRVSSEARHVDLLPVVDLYLDAQGRDIGAVSTEVERVLRGEQLPPGYSAKIRGEVSQMRESISALAGGFVLAALLVYLILVAQFRSYALPLLIMAAVPTGMAGIVLMLVLTGTYFSIQAAIGAIFMIGIAVANGVLLIEFIERNARDARDTTALDSAVVQGAQQRLRPILMTALASILGLTPMAIGIGRGSEANIPLGRAVVGGQLVSTLLTLFAVPVLYRLVAPRLHRSRAAESLPAADAA